MPIEFRIYDGQGNPEDPKVGKSFAPAPETLGGLLVGRTVKGIGRTGRGTEYVTLNLTGINMLFVTT